MATDTNGGAAGEEPVRQDGARHTSLDLRALIASSTADKRRQPPQSTVTAQSNVRARQLLPLSTKESYAWSWLRIWEQVTTNVLTVAVLAIAGGVGTLLYQHVFHFM